MFGTRVFIELEVAYPVGTLFMMNQKISGVYIIQNVVSDRCYVGATRDVTQRWRTHYRELADNRHINEYLQSEFTDAPDVFVFRLLEMCPVSDLRVREIHHASLHESQSQEWGYNPRPHMYPNRKTVRAAGGSYVRCNNR